MDISRDDLESERNYGKKPEHKGEDLDKVILMTRQEFSWNKMLGWFIKDPRFG